MKPFPYLIFRKTGADRKLLDQLMSTEVDDFIGEYQNLSSKIFNKGAVLKNVLLQYFHENSHQKKYNLILNIARDIHNGKHLKSKTIEKVSSMLSAELYQALLGFEALEKKQEIQKQNFITNYHDFKIKATRKLLVLTNEEDFKSGLLLSSSILFGQLGNIVNKDIGQFKKKDYQLVNGLLKYYSRMLCKTAIFSRFGTFSLARIAPLDTLCEFDFTTQKSKILSFPKINLKVFEWFQLLLQNHPELRRKLYLSWNNSLTVEEYGYLFLKNKQGVLVVQKLKKNELVDILLEFLKAKENVKLQDALAFLKNNIDADEEALEDYVTQLVGVGLLDLGINISNLDGYWMVKLIGVLDGPQMHASILIAKISTSLKSMITAEKKYGNSSLEEKASLVETIYLQLKGVADFLQKENKVDAELAFFPLKKHTIFYEDCKANFVCKVNAELIQETTDNLTQLCQSIPHFPVGNYKQQQMTDFFVQHYPKEETVNLLDFYLAYHSFVKEKKLNFQQDVYYETWKKTARDYFDNKLDGREQEVHLTTEDLQAIAKESKLDHGINTLPQSYSFFLQFYKNGSNFQAIINNVFTGYGKMFGRFLSLLPGEVTDALRHSLRDQFLDSQPVEIGTGTSFNANIHPNLTGAAIVLPGDYGVDLDTKKITLKDLVVGYDTVVKSLVLKTCLTSHAGRVKSTGQVCYPIDAGFQSPADLPEMNRFLLAFSPATLPGIYLLNKAMNDVWRKKHGGKLLVLPRIIFNQKILLQRKTWVFPSETLPKKLSAEKEANYFLRVQQWRLEYQIDKAVFVRYPKKIIQGNAPPQDYKPQYIHFGSLLLVRLFGKMIARRSEAILISEVLPGREDTLSVGKEKFVGEFLLEIEE